jgi:hypothetical protein
VTQGPTNIAKLDPEIAMKQPCLRVIFLLSDNANIGIIDPKTEATIDQILLSEKKVIAEATTGSVMICGLRNAAAKQSSAMVRF